MEIIPGQIAKNYLPQRSHYYYARIKLATDPLYRVAGAALAGNDHPLLDIGCGIGLLAHALRAQGCGAPYNGVDIDSAKIASAKAAAERGALKAVNFSELDLSQGFPAHQGSVALLDIVQFLEPEAQDFLLESAIGCLAPGAMLIMRTGLARPGWRLGFTRGVDRLARFVRWMNVGPNAYPMRDALEQRFTRHGLQATFQPLTGWLPFENWLITAHRSVHGTTRRNDLPTGASSDDVPETIAQGLKA